MEKAIFSSSLQISFFISFVPNIQLLTQSGASNIRFNMFLMKVCLGLTQIPLNLNLYPSKSLSYVALCKICRHSDNPLALIYQHFLLSIFGGKIIMTDLQRCISCRCTTQGFTIYCEMTATVSGEHPSPHTVTHFFFLVMRTFKIYTLSNFQIYKIALLTPVTTLAVPYIMFYFLHFPLQTTWGFGTWDIPFTQ